MRDLRYTQVPSPVGELLLTATERGLSGLYFENHRRGPGIDANWTRDDDVFAPAVRQLAEYFAGRRREFVLPLELTGTAFQRSVWAALGAVPFGTTCSYADLAKRIGALRAVRAVAAA